MRAHLGVVAALARVAEHRLEERALSSAERAGG